VVVIGGSLSEEDPDEQVMQWLRQVHPTTAWTTSACTSSIYLAAAGILDGQDASTHWARAGQLERRGARYTEQRMVERAKVITAAGVSAGIDMALTLLARIHGPQHAQMIQLAIEYDPRPPFRRRITVQGTGPDGGVTCDHCSPRRYASSTGRAQRRPRRCGRKRPRKHE
jgi:transcriptional regulator GlxA family with amidase domain